MAEHAVGTVPGAPPAGWYADPVYTGVHRYWDGGAWTRWVSDGQLVLADKFQPTTAAAPSVPQEPASTASLPEQSASQPSGEPARRPPSKRSWYLLACLAAGGVLAVALGVLLVVTTPPAPLYDIPAQAGFGALFVILGAAALVCALIDALVLVALRVRGTTASKPERTRP